jgi:hypothetical protein
MGVTIFEKKKLEQIIWENELSSVLEFGSQTNYTTSNQKYPPFMSDFYKSYGLVYDSIDLAGDNGAKKLNWSYPLGIFDKADLVTDFGSGEHSCQKEEYILASFHDGHINSIYPKGEPTQSEIEQGFYSCWENKHNALKLFGIMFNVNPLTGHWPEHGYSYLGNDFYNEFIKIAGYELIEDGVTCAMGNCETGKNVYGIIKKVSEEFPSIEQFSKLPIFKK